MENFFKMLQGLVVVLKSGQLPQVGLWTYVVLAMLVAVEGPIATLLGAAAASAGLMRPLAVLAAASAGNLTADMLWYSIGYMGKTEWIFRVARRMGAPRERLEQLEHSLMEHASKVIFLAKLTVSFVIPSLIAAGLVRVPWKRWFPPLFAAEMLWTGSLVLIGYYATEAIKRVEQGVEYLVLGISMLFVLFIILTGRRIFLRQSDNEKTTPNN